jgi:NAD-dependent deacetylase
MMAPAHDDIDALASALLGSERAVMLTGQRLDPEGMGELSRSQSEWAKRADLDALLTTPTDFWSYFMPASQAAARRTPTPGHRAITRLQQAGTVSSIITQGVDGLHERAGAHDVVEIYGNVLSLRCERCGERYGLDEAATFIAASVDGVPRCTTSACGYPLRPQGTLWNEQLPQEAVERAWDLAASTDLLVVVDSDLRTAPISFLPSVPLTRGVGLILVGATPTRYDRYADLTVRVPASAAILTAVADLITPRAP